MLLSIQSGDEGRLDLKKPSLQDDQTSHIIFDVGCEFQVGGQGHLILLCFDSKLINTLHFQATTIVLWNAPSRHWQNGLVLQKANKKTIFTSFF